MYEDIVCFQSNKCLVVSEKCVHNCCNFQLKVLCRMSGDITRQPQELTNVIRKTLL